MTSTLLRTELATAPTTSPVDAEDLRTRVQHHLDEFVSRRAAVLASISADLRPLADALVDLLGGGKRLRAAFCYWGWRGAGEVARPEAVAAAASLELFHAAALIHDDVMDASETRRGMPTVHRRFQARHRTDRLSGDPDRFGVAAAVLLGDLCLVWSDEMYAGCGLEPARLARGRRVFDLMRTQLMGGQYLDLLEQARRRTTVERARTVLRWKSAKYTVEQPLLLGGSLAGAPPELLDAYSAFGLALGEAFQLRDDLLGVFGDPAQTGKPVGDDLREGKPTVLVALARRWATRAQQAVLDALLGDPSLDERGVDELRAVVVETGALAGVERSIDRLRQRAGEALAAASVCPPADEVLAALAVAATRRAL
jgi:geranylgeranyl diphosphate synthase, type I